MSEPVASASPAQECDEQGRRLFRCGTLIYTRRGLVMLFAWLLWGDFCFTMMETVVPSILPLKLRALGSANWIIAAIMSTLPGIFNTTICPWVSAKSDHYRSRWGRRIPFILYTMPFLTASLLFIGFSDALGTWLHSWMFDGSTVKQTTVIIFLLAVFAGMFDLFRYRAFKGPPQGAVRQATEAVVGVVRWGDSRKGVSRGALAVAVQGKREPGAPWRGSQAAKSKSVGGGHRAGATGGGRESRPTPSR